MLLETSAIMPDAIGQFGKTKYLNLETFRKTGVGVRTPVWFAEDPASANGAPVTFYVYTLPDSGKAKRVRNNPKVRVHPVICAATCAAPGSMLAPASAKALRHRRRKRKEPSRCCGADVLFIRRRRGRDPKAVSTGDSCDYGGGELHWLFA